MSRVLGRSATGETKAVATALAHVFRHLIVFVVVLGVFLAGVIGYLLGSIRPEQARYRSAARALELVHAAMLDQETGLRGYLLVQDRAFLTPYRQGVATVGRQDPVLDRNLQADPRLAPLLLKMRLAEQAWSSGWATDVVTGNAPSESAGRAEFYARGKELFDHYRDAEVVLRSRLWARRDALYAREGDLLVMALALAVVLGAAFMVVVTRQRRVLERTLVGPVRDILAATEGVSRGDLSPQLVPAGPEEFRRIAVSVNRMRLSLADVERRRQAAQEQVELQAGQLSAILGMSREISGSLNLRYVLRTVGEVATGVSGFDRAVVWLADGDTSGVFEDAYDSNQPDAPSTGAAVEIGVGVVGQAVRYGRTATSNERGEPSVEVRHDESLRSLAVPLVVGARIIGAVELSSTEPHRMAGGTLDVVETLATHAAAAIEAARLHSDTESLAHTDALTGLANRRQLDHDLAIECERSGRYERPLGLLMFDVDHFKRLNDTHGHQRGDEVLQELTAVVRDAVRSTDTVYRYGGEEFVVVARETGHEDSVALAERLRRRIEEHFGAHGSPEPVTASFGVALVPPSPPDPSQLIASADGALYRAKAEGRNRVVMGGHVGG